MSDDIKPLSALKPGDTGRIVSVGGDRRLKQRLIAMGVTPEAWLIVRKFAPLGDPMEINIRNYSLSIRRKDARDILVDTRQESD